MRPLLILLAAIVCVSPALGDYVFRTPAGIERFSDNGRYLGPYEVVYRVQDDVSGETQEIDRTAFIDETVDWVSQGSDGRVYAIGNSLGNLTVRQFDPNTGETAGIDSASTLSSSVFLDDYAHDPQLSDRVPFGRSGNLMTALHADESGYLWGLGRIQQRDGFSLNPDLGWSLNRYKLTESGLDPGEPVEVVLQLGPSGDDLFPWNTGSFTVTSSSRGDVYLSTKHGLVDVGLIPGSDGIPGTPAGFNLWNTLVSNAIARGQDPFDPTESGSPYKPMSDWIHPLLGGENAGGWNWTEDGFIRVSQSNDGRLEILKYDLDERKFGESTFVNLLSGEILAGSFFRPDGVLMVLTSDMDNNQRLLAIDPIGGSLSDVVFDINTSELLGADWRYLAGGTYIVAVPEPSAAPLLAFSLAAAFRRANLAVR